MNKINQFKPGVIGLGYVGKAVFDKVNNHFPCLSFDINGSGNQKTLEDLVLNSNIIFLCLPTPMKKDGYCDLKIIINVLKSINDIVKSNHLIVIKSTIPPGSTKSFNNDFSNLNIVFNPEFLTEANFLEDFKNQNRIILGGNEEITKIVKSFYSNLFNEVPIIQTSSDTAEMVKYFANAYLATKVSYANEMFTLCKKLNIDYDSVVSLAIYDKRIGKSHLNVPGPDNKFGFGGSCFPKDINALISIFNDNDVECLVLDSVWKRNISIDRKDRDWEKLIGRSISDDE
tara:strand:- start:28831 stop:29688 length:858 start_codon:yes stop_codon:yes gene_type:complete